MTAQVPDSRTYLAAGILQPSSVPRARWTCSNGGPMPAGTGWPPWAPGSGWRRSRRCSRTAAGRRCSPPRRSPVTARADSLLLGGEDAGVVQDAAERDGGDQCREDEQVDHRAPLADGQPGPGAPRSPCSPPVMTHSLVPRINPAPADQLPVSHRWNPAATTRAMSQVRGAAARKASLSPAAAQAAPTDPRTSHRRRTGAGP